MCGNDRAVFQLDAELLGKRLMDLRRQAVRDRMAEHGKLGGWHAASLSNVYHPFYAADGRQAVVAADEMSAVQSVDVTH